MQDGTEQPAKPTALDALNAANQVGRAGCTLLLCGIMIVFLIVVSISCFGTTFLGQ